MLLWWTGLPGSCSRGSLILSTAVSSSLPISHQSGWFYHQIRISSLPFPACVSYHLQKATTVPHWTTKATSQLVSLPPSFLYSKPNKQIWSYLLQEVLTDSQAFLIRPAAHTSPSPTLYIPTSHLLSEETNLLSVNPLSKPLSTYVPQDSILLVLYDQGKRSFCRVTLLSLDIMFCSVVSPSEIWVQREQVIGIRMARIKTDLAKTQVGAGKQDQSHRVWALNKTEHTHKQSLHLHL